MRGGRHQPLPWRAADEASYDATQTDGLPVVYPDTAGRVDDVATLAPEAGTLLTAALPFLSLAQRTPS